MAGRLSYSEITLAETIAAMTLHRPEQLNAFTHLMRGERIDAFDAAEADDEVRAVIVIGAGRGFCAGADLSGARPSSAPKTGRRMPRHAGTPTRSTGLRATAVPRRRCGSRR
jgi:enoyl-CoA hydratase/carnithine racemase